MAAEHSHSAKGYPSSRFSRRRKGKPGLRKHGSIERAPWEEDKLLMVPSKRQNRLRKSFVEDPPAARLVKIEFDAAQALAEFSRIACLPVQCNSGEHNDVGLQWFGKRKRSTRSNKDAGLRDMESDSSKRSRKTVTAPVRAHGEDKAQSLARDREELENNESSRESVLSDSRAESPSSPLPSECRSLLLGGRSAFQRVVPMMPGQKPCPAPIKTKIEDIHIDAPLISTSPPHKMTVKRKPSFFKPLTSAKLEQRQVANSLPSAHQQGQAKDLNDIGCQALTLTQSGVEALVDPAAQGVENRRQVGIGEPKSTFTEMEKETRRFRRIQANRESARQTIRRKQVLCKELTKKASGLALENESMKQKKEMLMQELQSLKGQNCQLKQQLMIPSSNDMGQDLLLQSSRINLQPVSSSSHVPGTSFAGMPLQSFVWAVAQATTTNAESTLHSGEAMSEIGQKSTKDSQSTWLGPGGTEQHLAPTFLLCHPSGIALSNQVSASSVSEQKTVCISNDSSSRMPDSLPKEEIICVSRACIGSPGIQSLGPPCEQESGSDYANLAARDAHLVSERLDGAGLVKIASFQPDVRATTFKSQGSKSAVDDTCGSSIGSGNTGNCFGSVAPQLARALTSYGFTLNGSRTGVALEWSPQTCSFTGKKVSAAAIAAAEARRRRKELTRSKFLQYRALRLHR